MTKPSRSLSRPLLRSPSRPLLRSRSSALLRRIAYLMQTLKQEISILHKNEIECCLCQEDTCVNKISSRIKISLNAKNNINKTTQNMKLINKSIMKTSPQYCSGMRFQKNAQEGHAGIVCVNCLENLIKQMPEERKTDIPLCPICREPLNIIIASQSGPVSSSNITPGSVSNTPGVQDSEIEINAKPIGVFRLKKQFESALAAEWSRLKSKMLLISMSKKSKSRSKKESILAKFKKDIRSLKKEANDLIFQSQNEILRLVDIRDNHMRAPAPTDTADYIESVRKLHKIRLDLRCEFSGKVAQLHNAIDNCEEVPK